MRSRAPLALLPLAAAFALAPAAAHAAASAAPANITPYTVEVTGPDDVAQLQKIGVDMTETGYDQSNPQDQNLGIYLTSSQADQLENLGLDPEVAPLDQPATKNKAIGLSPNPYFNVWRSYSEPGGIADEMRATAAANPDVMKLENLGTSTLGKPILAIKMTKNARTTPDGARPALLYSAVNHAREWLAAEQGRRLPIWFAQHKNDPKIQDIIAKSELWFLPIQNVDGYDFTFTCGTGVNQVSCDYRVRTADDNRFWRKTIRDNNNNGVYGDSQDGVDPNRNYPAKRAHRRRGRQQQLQQRDLPRPVRAVRAREPRRRPPAAARQVPRQHQLPHRRPAAADAGFLHDRLRAAGRDDLRGHDRHRRRLRRLPVHAAALVGPL